jgi:hypothetical protein
MSSNYVIISSGLGIGSPVMLELGKIFLFSVSPTRLPPNSNLCTLLDFKR